MMEPFGNVLHAVVLLDMTTGQSRGFGFVHMDNAESASSAASGMTGKVGTCFLFTAPVTGREAQLSGAVLGTGLPDRVSPVRPS